MAHRSASGPTPSAPSVAARAATSSATTARPIRRVERTTKLEFDRDKVIDYVERQGRSRAREQGSEFSEADFLAGAMSVFFALGYEGEIPPLWIFPFFRGDSPLGLNVPPRTAYVVQDGRSRIKAGYERRADAIEHLNDMGDDNDATVYAVEV